MAESSVSSKWFSFPTHYEPTHEHPDELVIRCDSIGDPGLVNTASRDRRLRAIDARHPDISTQSCLPAGEPPPVAQLRDDVQSTRRAPAGV